MSMIADGRRIRCDGPGCPAQANAPVGHRQTASEGAARGWLFLFNLGAWSHLCPACMHQYGEADAYLQAESLCANVGQGWES
jgi:hypothetical protein